MTGETLILTKRQIADLLFHFQHKTGSTIDFLGGKTVGEWYKEVNGKSFERNWYLVGKGGSVEDVRKRIYDADEKERLEELMKN